jgi:hypothetical protein
MGWVCVGRDHHTDRVNLKLACEQGREVVGIIVTVEVFVYVVLIFDLIDHSHTLKIIE